MKRSTLIFAWPIMVAVILLCGACGVSNAPAPSGGKQAGQGGGPGSKFAAIPVEAVSVKIGPLTAVQQTSGTVQPVTLSQVATEVAGVVLRLNHVAGDWVQAGESVVQLDPSQLQLTLQSAQAALETAKVNLASATDTTSQTTPSLQLSMQSAQSALDSAQKTYDADEALLKIGGIAASAADSAESAVKTAQANLQIAKTNLDINMKAGQYNLKQLQIAVDQAQVGVQQAQLNLRYMTISAPFAGQISVMNVQPGEYVSLNTQVFTLVSQARQISFSAQPSDAVGLIAGTPLQFTYNGQVYQARVSQAPSAPVGGLVPMLANITSRTVPPFGTVGQVSYSVTLSNGALIPVSALQSNENQYFVYSVVNKKAIEQSITILGESGTLAAVEGLGEGALVITAPPPGLVTGSNVVVSENSAAGTTSDANKQGAPNAQGAVIGDNRKTALGNTQAGKP